MLTSAMNTTPNTTTTSIPETTNTTTPTTSSQLTTLIEPTPITTLTTSIDPITITTLTTSTVDTTLFPPLKGSKREINVSEESLPTEIQEQMNKGLKEYSIQNYAESAEIFSQTAEQVYSFNYKPIH